jgi:hypothetical protein
MNMGISNLKLRQRVNIFCTQIANQITSLYVLLQLYVLYIIVCIIYNYMYMKSVTDEQLHESSGL